jgi:hypothetical protein
LFDLERTYSKDLQGCLLFIKSLIEHYKLEGESYVRVSHSSDSLDLVESLFIRILILEDEVGDSQRDRTTHSLNAMDQNLPIVSSSMFNEEDRIIKDSFYVFSPAVFKVIGFKRETRMRSVGTHIPSTVDHMADPH